MKALTATEMREVDRLTTERFGIPSLQLMESAGKKAADAVWYPLQAANKSECAFSAGKEITAAMDS